MTTLPRANGWMSQQTLCKNQVSYKSVRVRLFLCWFDMEWPQFYYACCKTGLAVLSKISTYETITARVYSASKEIPKKQHYFKASCHPEKNILIETAQLSQCHHKIHNFNPDLTVMGQCSRFLWSAVTDHDRHIGGFHSANAYVTVIIIDHRIKTRECAESQLWEHETSEGWING